VTTSASRLHDLLKKVGGEKPNSNDQSFGSRAVFVLGLQHDQTGEAYIVVRDKVKSLFSDVSNGLDQEQVTHVMTLCAPYRKLIQLSTHDQPIKNLASNNGPLAHNSMSHLKTLDLILSARVTRDEPEFQDYKDTIDSLRAELKALNIDPLLSTAISKRINQVEFAIKNYLYVGPSTLVESVETLLGSVELLVPSKKKKSTKGKAFRAGVGALVGTVILALTQAEKAGDTVISLIEHKEKFTGYLEDFSKPQKQKSSEEE